MKADKARELKVGDFVTASFGRHCKVCEIITINWPWFVLKAKFSKGEFAKVVPQHIGARDGHGPQKND